MTHAPAIAPLPRRLREAGLDWIVPDWPAPPHVQAFSTTRNGEGATLFDLSRRARADASTRERLRRWLPADPVWLAQVHGNAVCDADAVRDGHDDLRQADAVVARASGTVCAVLTADCVPVLFTDLAGSVVAAAHAGWRGLAAGVLEATLKAMRVEPGEVLVWLGPAIGPRAFEVGADVLAAHAATDPGASACFAPLRSGKWLADLYGLARRRLARAGVTAIRGGDRCTFTESAVFHSYRRDGAAAAGRMAALIWREDA
jgi:YfiH family protein